MIKLFKVKEKQRENAENANGKTPGKKQSAGELRLHRGSVIQPPLVLYLSQGLLLVRYILTSISARLQIGFHFINTFNSSFFFNITTFHINSRHTMPWNEEEKKFSYFHSLCIVIWVPHICSWKKNKNVYSFFKCVCTSKYFIQKIIKIL